VPTLILNQWTQNSITDIAIASSEGGPPPSFAIEKTIKAQFSPITSRIELDKNKESVKGVAFKRLHYNEFKAWAI
jgi:hypothetical protein